MVLNSVPSKRKILSVKRYGRKFARVSSLHVNKRSKRNKTLAKKPSEGYNQKVKSSPTSHQVGNTCSKSQQVRVIEKIKFIYLVRGRDVETLSRVWHYVSVDENNHGAFLSKVKTFGAIDLSEYGEVLYSGWGEHPPLEVVRNVNITRLLPFFKRGLRELGLNCVAIKKT